MRINASDVAILIGLNRYENLKEKYNNLAKPFIAEEKNPDEKILNLYENAREIKLKERQVRNSKKYNINNVNFEIIGVCDALLPNKIVEIRNRIGSLSYGIRKYEKPQFIIYMDLFNRDTIEIFEQKDNDYRLFDYKLKNSELYDTLECIAQFVTRYELFDHKKYLDANEKTANKMLKKLFGRIK